MYKCLLSFLRSDAGNIGLMGALIMLPILGAVGVAVDYARVANVRSDLQNSADAAVLAVVQDVEKLSNPEIQTQVEQFFTANSDAKIRFSRDVSTQGRVREASFVVTANTTVDTIFMHLLGSNRSNISAVSEALIAQSPVEMALVIDNTTSMNFGTTWNTVANAIGRTLDTIDNKTTSGGFHVTLVPFTNRVNISTARSDWLGFRSGDAMGNPGDQITSAQLTQWEGCVEPRETPLSGLPYAIDLNAGPGEFLPTAPGFWSGSTAGGRSDCAAPMFGPSADIAQAKQELRGLGPRSATGRFDDALAWGWRTISPAWRGEWGAGPNIPSNQGDREKIVAIFTDGKTNINHDEMEHAIGEFGDNNGSVSVFEHFLHVCDTIKDAGARVFVFDTGANTHAENYFRTCAENDYFKIDSEAALLAAIEDLGDNTVVPRLIR